MSKVIIYDNKKILIANLDRTETKRKDNEVEHTVIFKEYRILHSISLKKQLKKIEQIFKYYKEVGGTKDEIK